MKKILLLLVAMFVFIGNINAQTWNMVVTHNDGTVQVIKASDVKNVTFQLPDQNADQVIIKELYTTGVPDDKDPKKFFQSDKGFILYNNGGKTAVISNLAIGMLDPYNAHSGANAWYSAGATEPSYVSQNWVPATAGIWYFQNSLVIEPYSQVVISCMGAIDNTKTYSKSVNYANKDYYTMYAPESGFDNQNYYPTPADVIPAIQYLKAAKFGQANAWPLSQSSPAFFIFQTKGITPAEYAKNPSNITYAPGKAQNKINAVLKVPTDWIIDGVEVYEKINESKSKKRFGSDVDAGYVMQTIKLGHSVYRNVDAEATKKIEGNADKLVYNYQYGADPSHIDAEASMKNGAKIVYMDTNNSTSDFHERKQFSLRDK